MEVLDSGFQVLDPGFFVSGTRFRILSLATFKLYMYSGLQSPGFQIPRPTIFGFLIPRSELPYVWRQGSLLLRTEIEILNDNGRDPFNQNSNRSDR